MKFLRMKLANWLSNGGYLAACKAATHWEENYQLMQDKAVKLEQTLIQLNKMYDEEGLAGRARINQLATERDRMSEALDRIIRYGEDKIGPGGNGSLRCAVRMAEEGLYPDGKSKTFLPDNWQMSRIEHARHQGETSL